MKYIITIFVSSILLGGLLTAGSYYLLGVDAGYFFAKFLAGPAGLIGSVVLFVAYDNLWPKNTSNSIKPDTKISDHE